MTMNNLPQLGPGELEPAVDLVTVYHQKTGQEMKLQLSALAGNPPSGVAGAIQFSNGSAFASDAANLFWDDTNNRLGVGTNAPSAILQAQNATNGVLLARFKDAVAASSYIDIINDATLNEYTGLYWGTERKIMSKQGGALFISCDNSVNFINGLQSVTSITPTEVQIGNISGARLGIKGSGSTSATTSLLVQNSAGTTAVTVRDDLSVGIYANTQVSMGLGGANTNNAIRFLVNNGNGQSFIDGYCDGPSYPIFIGSRGFQFGSSIAGATTQESGTPVVFGSAVHNASAIVQINSTTRGFLPPRMTTTQKNAIASPAAGLVVYDSTTNKLQCYNGSTWNDLF